MRLSPRFVAEGTSSPSAAKAKAAAPIACCTNRLGYRVVQIMEEIVALETDSGRITKIQYCNKRNAEFAQSVVVLRGESFSRDMSNDFAKTDFCTEREVERCPRQLRSDLILTLVIAA
jgi:hypothetical protein